MKRNIFTLALWIAAVTSAPPVSPRTLASEIPFSKNIYFGDLHVHTTYSFDGDLYSVPAFGDDGAHPPSDACEFARYCSNIDFFALTDHAESFTPDRWWRTRRAARECESRFSSPGDPLHPALVPFVGWEWTQVGDAPATHYGHRNLVFPGLADHELPERPIGALKSEEAVDATERFLAGGLKVFRPFSGISRYSDLLSMMGDLASQRECPPTLRPRDPLTGCRENVPDPSRLFAQLDTADFDYLPIIHGSAWGTYAPPGADIGNMLDPGIRRPGRPALFEVFSGHGNSEQYRDFPDGSPSCPPPTAGYYPCCWRAGEIMRSRCQGLSPSECDRRVEKARRLALAAGDDPFSVFTDARPEDWLDCDQFRGAFKPDYSYRPRESAQYALALGDFDHLDASGRPGRFEFGLVASSDNHAARAGTGYKQFAREYMTDVRGYENDWIARKLERMARGRQKDPRMPQPHQDPGRLLGLLDVERDSSFMYTGGLVAVHAPDKSRGSIWNALETREVYATSGPKILLWFYLENSPEGIVPMGAKVEQDTNPRFRVRALGSFIQKPGCPADSIKALGRQGILRLCRGECDYPSDRRHSIRAIEVIRIRPQRYRGEPVGPLIEDPWKVLECPPGRDACEVEFEDPDFTKARRDTVYYLRALQEPTKAINGAQLRTVFDRRGEPLSVTPCYAGKKTPRTDDCLAPVRERAWSSPIYVNWK